MPNFIQSSWLEVLTVRKQVFLLFINCDLSLLQLMDREEMASIALACDGKRIVACTVVFRMFIVKNKVVNCNNMKKVYIF